MLEFAATIAFLLIAAKVVVSMIEKYRGKPFEMDETLFHAPQREPRRPRRNGVFNERGEFLGWIKED